MDRDQLIAFERIVREGSFNRAARSLGLAQATISGRIAALEATLGGPLFARGGRRATLTARGDTFLPYVRRALAILDEGIEAARQAHDGAGGTVALATIESIADGFLVPAIARFRREHPTIALSIRGGHTPQLIQELIDGSAHLALVTWQYTAGTRDLAVLARFRERLVAVVAPGHPLAVRATVSAEAVVAEGAPYHETVWGTPEDARLVRDTERGWREREFPHGLMHRLILDGIGAGFLPAPIVRADIAAGRLVALPLPDGEQFARELALIRAAGTEPLPRAAQLLADTIRAEISRAER